MKKYLSLLCIALLAFASCSEEVPLSAREGEPISAQNELISESDSELISARTGEPISADIDGSYVSTTHSPTDLIEFYPGGSFHYQADCNNQSRVNDFATWRIGRYAGSAEALTLSYEDGGTAYATVYADSLVYLEGNLRRVFLPSASVNFTVTKNPNFAGSHE